MYEAYKLNSWRALEKWFLTQHITTFSPIFTIFHSTGLNKISVLLVSAIKTDW